MLFSRKFCKILWLFPDFLFSISLISSFVATLEKTWECIERKSTGRVQEKSGRRRTTKCKKGEKEPRERVARAARWAERLARLNKEPTVACTVAGLVDYWSMAAGGHACASRQHRAVPSWSGAPLRSTRSDCRQAVSLPSLPLSLSFSFTRTREHRLFLLHSCS